MSEFVPKACIKKKNYVYFRKLDVGIICVSAEASKKDCWSVKSHSNYRKVMFEKHLGNCEAEKQTTVGTNLTVYFLNWRFTSTEKKTNANGLIVNNPA